MPGYHKIKQIASLGYIPMASDYKHVYENEETARVPNGTHGGG